MSFARTLFIVAVIFGGFGCQPDDPNVPTPQVDRDRDSNQTGDQHEAQ